MLSLWDTLLETLVGQPVSFGNGQRVGQPIGRFSDNLKSSQGWIVRYNRTDHANRFLAEGSQFINESDTHSQCIHLQDLFQDLFAQEESVTYGGRGENLIQDDQAI